MSNTIIFLQAVIKKIQAFMIHKSFFYYKKMCICYRLIKYSFMIMMPCYHLILSFITKPYLFTFLILCKKPITWKIKRQGYEREIEPNRKKINFALMTDDANKGMSTIGIIYLRSFNVILPRLNNPVRFFLAQKVHSHNRK